MSLSHPERAGKSIRAFTLVELLVVIGIIALLISVLLPALSRARKSAGAIKCAASIREIGNALKMYSIDSKGWYPPPQLVPTGVQYNIDGVDYPSSGANPYWFNFLAKYVTKNKIGSASTTAIEAADGRKSIFWACPEWEGYTTTAIGGKNRVQVGYGMNLWPTFNKGYPDVATNFPPAADCAFISSWTPTSMTGKWYKEKVWTRDGSNRVIIADSRFWAIESNPLSPGPGNSVVYPPQPNINNSETYTSGISGQTMIDVYRHGKYPNMFPGKNAFSTSGGKVSYNCLWGDGHVSTEPTQEAAYKGLRFRIPN